MLAFLKKLNYWVKIQLNHLKLGGVKALNHKLKKIFKIFIVIFLSIIFLPFFLIVRLVSNKFLIRFGLLPSKRIGHFANDVNLYLRTNEKTVSQLDIFYLEKPVCNNALLRIYKRYLIIFPELIIYPFVILNKITLIGNLKHNIKLTPNFPSLDLRDRRENEKKIVYFNSEDIKIGHSYLENLGIKKNEKYVCLLCRDDAYVKDIFNKTYDRDYQESGDVSKFRNVNIENFRLVSEYLTNLGYYVIRMGKNVSKPFSINNHKFIDYATSSKKSDFLDIFLPSNCEFFLSSAAGLDIMAAIFNRPIVFTSYTTIGFARSTNKKQLQIFKHLRSLKSKKKLSLSEIFDLNLASAEKDVLFKDKQVELIENSPEEIKEAVEDMLELIQNNFVLDEMKLHYHKMFWDIFKKNIKKHNLEYAHSNLYKAHVGYNFLMKNKNFLE
mgnify:FL=1